MKGTCALLPGDVPRSVAVQWWGVREGRQRRRGSVPHRSKSRMFRLGADGGRRGERALSAWRARVRSAPYVAALLRDGLGVPEARVRVGSGREAWTLGAALAEGGRAAPAPHDVQVWVWGRTCAPA